MGCGRNMESSSSSSHGHEEKHHNVGCICEVVKTILRLQNRAVRNDDTCGTSCFVEPIGGISKHGKHADTRVFMLLDKNGKPFKVLFMDKDWTFHFTPFFRVEDVFGDCCATLRAVAPVEENGDTVDVIDPDSNNLIPEVFSDIFKYKKTDTCVTVDLNDFTAIQCVADVDLNIHHH